MLSSHSIIRDQASKTFEVYLQRVRQYSATLPETALPAQGLNSASNGPRVAAQSDSWTGWAISSFTNKISTVKGDMQAASNGQSSLHLEVRSSSVPRSSSSTRTPSPSLASASQGRKQPLPTPLKPSLSSYEVSKTSSLIDRLDDKDADISGDIAKEFDPFAEPVPASTTDSNASLLDQDEPDFASWLAAQADSKQKAKKPLPKGLGRVTSTGRQQPTSQMTPLVPTKAPTNPQNPARLMGNSRNESKTQKAAEPSKLASSSSKSKITNKDDSWDESW